MTAPGRRLHHFASDNTAGICPEALAALNAANAGRVGGYGNDPYTLRAKARLREIFETECEVFFVFTGTAGNALTLATLCRSYHSIFAHEGAHVLVGECGAPEFFTGGAKVVPVAGARGKIALAGLEEALGRGLGYHLPKPGALSLTQSSDWGTLYLPEDTRQLADLAHARGMRVHLDGARFANAAAALAPRGFSPADLTWRAGIDVLSFGGTKNGMLAAEAVVFFQRELAAEFGFRATQAGQISSKMRFAAAQWEAMLADGAWLRCAGHANRMAQKLADGLRALPGIALTFAPETNMVIAEIPPAAAARLRALGWIFHTFIGENGSRLMCAWDTTEDDLAVFLADLRAALAN